MEDRGNKPAPYDGNEEREVAVACQKCGKTLQESATTAVYCGECLSVSGETVVPLFETEVKTDVQKMTAELSRAVEHCKEVTPEIEKLKLQTEKNYREAQEQIRQTMLELRLLIDDKEDELLQKVEEIKCSKLVAFSENQTMFSDLSAQMTTLVAESSVSESAAQDLLSHGPTLLASLSSPFPPHSSHITAHAGLGFNSNVKESMMQVLSACMWVSGEDVRVGERMAVSAVGGLQPDGSFWVRQIHADPHVLWQQEIALTHISNSLCDVVQFSDPLPECGPGQLCVAQFSQDGRWYRAVVVDIPKPGVAKYFFLDHGGSEVAPMSSLYPLDDHFRALPFQMIHVKLTTDSSIDFNSREMRWCFTDYTHKKNLVAEILSLCEIDVAGPVYHIKLEDHSQAEPFDVGQILITSAQVKESKSTFRSRDVRFKDKPPSTTPTEQAMSTTQTTPTASTSTAATSVALSSQPTVSESTSDTHTQPPPSQPVTATSASSDSEPTAAVTKDTSQPQNSPLPPSPPLPSHSTPSPTPEDPPLQTLPPSQPTPSQNSPLSQNSQHPSSQNPPLSQPTSSPSLPLQNTVSQNSSLLQLSPSLSAGETDLDSGCDTIPTPVCSDTMPDDSSLDTIPLDSSPDSRPHRNVPELIPTTVSLDSIPQSSNSDSIPKELHTDLQLKPLQLNETEGVLLSNKAPPTDDVISAEDLQDGDIDSLHPYVKTGAQLSVDVTTDLSLDGQFWCSLLLPGVGDGEEGEGGAYVRLQDELQTIPGRGDGDLYTPVFYSEGDVCAASFSEDGEWYRARIEKVIPEASHTLFTVRYLDFGNSEERQQHHLMVLGSKFRLLPPQAIHCSLATDDHPKFTQAELEKFGEVCGHNDIIAEVLEVGDDGLVRVKLLLALPDREPEDLSEKIYSAKPSVGVPYTARKMPTRQWSSSTDLEPQHTAHVADWASHMEDHEDDIVFLTLPGHESSRETTPSLRESTPTNRREAMPIKREASLTASQREVMPEPAPREATPTTQREATPIIREPAPREATPTKQREATPIVPASREATPTRRPEATPTKQREATPIRSEPVPASREATPTRREPVPAPREATPTRREPVSAPREATPIRREPVSAPREATPIRQEATPTYQREATPTTRDVSPAKQREATPTIRREASPITMAAKTQEATPTQQEAPSQRDAAPTQWVPLKSKETAFLQRATGNESARASGRQARLDLNRAKHSIFSSLGARSVPRPSSTLGDESDGISRGRGRSSRSRLLRQDQRKIYVKCVPQDKSDSKIRELFSCYGDVIDIDHHTTDPTVLYVVMDVKGAEDVVANMNGYQIAPGHKLVVEKYRNHSPSPSPSPLPASSELPEHVRLFVKNVSADHDSSSLKSVFSRYGRVLKILPDLKRRNVTYVYMDVEGGNKAINNLHGKAISKNGKPLIVELSYEPKNR